jgi:DNA-binding transcriptional MerR regulator
VTIGNLSKASGVAASAIRYYEAAGILPVPRRTGGVRDYDAGAVHRIKLLRFYRSGGMSVRSLAAADRRAAVQRRIAEIDEGIARARVMKKRLERSLACECHGDLEKCPLIAQPSSPSIR